MKSGTMPGLRIGDLDIPVPIIQGGMGVGISLAGLAGAVAAEGAVGVIASVGIGQFEPDIRSNYKEANRRALRNSITKAKEISNGGVIGVNIMVALTDFDELVLGAIEEHADLVLMGAGLPLKLPEGLPLKDLGSLKTKFVPIVSSSKAANLIFRQWEKRYDFLPDAVVVEGPLAGGHLGFSKAQIDDPEYRLENLVVNVIKEVKSFEEKAGKKIPVIAAGGVYTGADIYDFMKLGADGVQMATRFVATHECDASQAFKDAYIKAKKEDIVIIDSPVGLPGRAINNKFLEDTKNGVKKKFHCPWKCLKSCDIEDAQYCIADALTSAQNGKFDSGFPFAGANAYKVDRIISVHDLLNAIKDEYKEAALAG